MSTYIDDLNWRYATKKFDINKEVSSKDLQTLLEAIQLTASSYGLQPYEIIIIKDAALREELKAHSWNQTQITDASEVIVFANKTHITSSYVDSYLQDIAQTRGLKTEDLQGLKGMVESTIMKLNPEDQNTWAAKQAYIALGNLLSAAANLRIDTCPMEGFDAAKYDQLLNLKERGLTTAVIVTIGYRSEDDQTQFAAKVRKSKEDLINKL
ncbi:NAD(P)H-dependent oxidoreductase [Gillisia hiemivivida]|jgi:nitroreductase|uniref:NAD(P)H-dependent oxidoreductase n=1 Tax=Gillisia hiemivivida TaxID=291190 RepID=A0A5C6ZTI3_9FLAO|nr:NAD(P)H-dependent oxidoreductase [Gillisia hiemivivida]TXD93419.1 NAD(P)H-dependent oxidoreductase [Gillisia hiemivivida]